MQASGPAVTHRGGQPHDVTHVHRDPKAAATRPDKRTHRARDGSASMTGPDGTHHLAEHGRFAEINPACDLEQRWCNGWHSWVRRSDGGFDPDLYEVHPISDSAAKSYVERMHYSGSYVAASRRYGMFIDTPDGPDLVGVAVFAIPAQARVLTTCSPNWCLIPKVWSSGGSSWKDNRCGPPRNQRHRRGVRRATPRPGSCANAYATWPATASPAWSVSLTRYQESSRTGPCFRATSGPSIRPVTRCSPAGPRPATSRSSRTAPACPTVHCKRFRPKRWATPTWNVDFSRWVRGPCAPG